MVVFWEVGGGYGGFAAENWRRRLVVVMVLEREMFRRERDGEKKEGVAEIIIYFFLIKSLFVSHES